MKNPVISNELRIVGSRKETVVAQFSRHPDSGVRCAIGEGMGSR